MLIGGGSTSVSPKRVGPGTRLPESHSARFWLQLWELEQPTAERSESNRNGLRDWCAVPWTVPTESGASDAPHGRAPSALKPASWGPARRRYAALAARLLAPPSPSHPTRQASWGPRGLRPPGVAPTVETLKDPFRLPRRNPWPLVGDRELSQPSGEVATRTQMGAPA